MNHLRRIVRVRWAVVSWCPAVAGVWLSWAAAGEQRSAWTSALWCRGLVASRAAPPSTALIRTPSALCRGPAALRSRRHQASASRTPLLCLDHSYSAHSQHKGIIYTCKSFLFVVQTLFKKKKKLNTNLSWYVYFFVGNFPFLPKINHGFTTNKIKKPGY